MLGRALRILRRNGRQELAPPSPFVVEVFDKGEFEHDWFTVHIPVWDRLLQPLEQRGARVLELGAFEGLSACYLLWRLPDAHVTCVDTFDYFDISGLEARFDRNVALVDSTRLRRLTGYTRDVLPRLLDEQAMFDFIYVDASHLALDVLADAAQTWKMLAVDGLVVFDDYGLDYDDPMDSVTRALDAFQTVVASEAVRVDAGGQFALRKRTTTGWATTTGWTARLARLTHSKRS